MRSTATVLALFGGACAADPECAPGSQVEGGACGGDPTDGTDPSDDFGNDILLSSYPPVVVASDPPSGALGVDPSLATLRVTFSQPMAQDRWSWVRIDPDLYPDDAAATVDYVDAFTNELDGVGLADEHAYAVWINSPTGNYTNFQDADHDPAVAFPLVFATGGDPSLLADLPAVVIGSTPAAGEEDVDPALDRLTFTFSKPLGAAGVVEQDSRKTWPEVASVEIVDPRTAEATVALEPSTTYAVWVRDFVDGDGVIAAEWLLTFRTADP